MLIICILYMSLSMTIKTPHKPITIRHYCRGSPRLSFAVQPLKTTNTSTKEGAGRYLAPGPALGASVAWGGSSDPGGARCRAMSPGTGPLAVCRWLHPGPCLDTCHTGQWSPGGWPGLSVSAPENHLQTPPPSR